MEKRLDDLKRLANVMNDSRDELCEAQVASTMTPRQYVHKDIDYAVAALSCFDRQLDLLFGGVSEARRRRGVGDVSVQLSYNTPMSGFALSFASAYVFAENNINIKFPSMCTALCDRFADLIGKHMPELAHNGNGTSIFSSEGGATYLRKRLSRPSGIVQIYGHPKMITDEVIAMLRMSGTSLILEGPGNNPSIVSADADIAAAAKTVAILRTSNSGQLCMGTEIAYVHQDVYEEFLAALLAELRGLKAGAAGDGNVAISPVPASTAREGLRLLNDALAKGARIRTPDSPAVTTAADDRFVLVPATVVDNVDGGSDILKFEKFCPILPVVPYRTDRELMDALSVRDYFLSSTIYCDETKHPELVAFLKVNFGKCFVNTNALCMRTGFNPLMHPWGGFGNSRVKWETVTHPCGRREFRRSEGPNYLVMDFSVA